MQDERKMAKFAQYAVAATDEALEDAGWKPTKEEEKEATVRENRSRIWNFTETSRVFVLVQELVLLMKYMILLLRTRRGFNHPTPRSFSCV